MIDANHEADIRLINVNELSEILGISKRTIFRLLSAQKLVKPVRINGSVRWRFGEVRQWIEAGCPESS